MMNTFATLEMLGTVTFAISGAIAAIRHKVDIGAVIVIAFLVGNGGGTLRGMMLGQGAVFWIQQKQFLLYAAVAGLATFAIIALTRKLTPFMVYYKYSERWINTVFIWFDAIAVGIFAVGGAQITLNKGFDPVIAVIMGMVTCVGGGTIRDLLLGEIPIIVSDEFYMTVALFGAIVYVLLVHDISNIVAAYISMIAVTAVRLVGYYRQWRLPRISLGD
jgi:uncharacterized membrane protein YeiH